MVFAAVERTKPTRIVIDSLSEIRLLAQSSLRYRRQLLAMKHYFARSSATVLALDDLTAEANDKTAHSIAHGVVRLEELMPSYGAERRRLRVMKYRGQRFRGGFHDFTIKTGGLEVYPRLVSGEHRIDQEVGVLSSGNPELDALLGGGLERGSSTLVLGPAGAGKSLLVLQFIAAASERDEKSALFVFDEELGLLFRRLKGMGIDLEHLRKTGRLIVEQVDTAELSPGEFTHQVRKAVEESGARTVAIDSLNGYQQAMPEESSLILHMHELLQFLNRRGTSTFLTVAQHGLVGEMRAPVEVTYLADTVILLRFFEGNARVRRAVSVIKKRTGMHEDTIREFKITSRGLILGPPLTGFDGVLRGTPTYRGADHPLLREDQR
jgi:circadian clock protein KaiC